jgi:amino acid transporter
MSNKVGLLPCLAYTLGSIIGSGIFVAPTSVILHSGSAGLSLCLWVGGAIISAIGALVYVELGTCITESGGGFAYQMKAGW